MKTLKMSLENIQGKMSRKEMRNIMAGDENQLEAPDSQGGGGGNCCVKSIAKPEYSGGTHYWGCNYSQSEAISLATYIGIEGAARGYWCCASC